MIALALSAMSRRAELAIAVLLAVAVLFAVLAAIQLRRERRRPGRDQ